MVPFEPPQPRGGYGVNTPFAYSGRARTFVAMSVILRHAESGSFYGGPHCWVNDPERALDLETVERAVEAGREEDLGRLEIVAWFDRLDRELVFPVRLNRTSRGKALPLGGLVNGCARGRVALGSEEPRNGRPRYLLAG